MRERRPYSDGKWDTVNSVSHFVRVVRSYFGINWNTSRSVSHFMRE